MDYRSLGASGLNVPVIGLGTANFGALFLYITSAPAFVLDMLKLNEQQFGYFFVPTIAGMVIGAYFSGRAAGRTATSVAAADTR